MELGSNNIRRKLLLHFYDSQTKLSLSKDRIKQYKINLIAGLHIIYFILAYSCRDNTCIMYVTC